MVAGKLVMDCTREFWVVELGAGNKGGRDLDVFVKEENLVGLGWIDFKVSSCNLAISTNAEIVTGF